MNKVKNESIIESLYYPKEIFFDNRQDMDRIYLSYPNEKDETIEQAITAINNMMVNSETNHILLNKNSRADEDKLHIQLDIGENETMYLGTAPCKESKYNELLIYKDEDIDLFAFFYFNKIAKDTSNQLTADETELLELLGIEANEDYVCKKIEFKVKFTL